MRPPAHRYAAIDGIRGVAAIAVVLFHCGLICKVPWLVGHGGWAVDVFFVMSGFVVDRAYGARLRSGWRLVDFAVARWVRLYPLYLVGLLLGLALRCAALGWEGTRAAADALTGATVLGALLIPTVQGGREQVFVLDSPCWSLFVEAVMNLSFAAALRRRPALSPGMPVGAATAVLILAALLGEPLLHGGASATLWVDLARGAFGLGAGVAISQAALRGRLDPLRSWPTTPLAAGLLAALLLPPGPADAWLDLAGILVLSPAIVILAVAREPSSARLRHLCSQLGAVSYPLYILHMPVLTLAAVWFRASDGGMVPPRLLPMLAAAGLSLGLAAAAARWIEPVLTGTARRWTVPTRRPPHPSNSVAVAAEPGE